MSDSVEPPTDDELMGPDELRQHFREWYGRNFGTRDVGEGLRRLTVLQEWRRA